MDLQLIIQVIISFLLGGAFIAGLTLLAERANEKIAGIIMMFPSTIVLGFFFLGWTVSPVRVAEVVPATIIPLGLLVLSSAIYIYTALMLQRVLHSRIAQIIVTTIISAVAWFVLAAPFAIIQYSNLAVGIVGYIVIIIFTHYILHRAGGKVVVPTPQYTYMQIFYRAVFMGTVIAIVVLLGKVFNTFWGGIFTMFPAATFSALVFFHLHYPPQQLFSIMKKAPLGSIALVAYTLMVMLVFPQFGIVLGSILAYGVSVVISLIVMKISTHLS